MLFRSVPRSAAYRWPAHFRADTSSTLEAGSHAYAALNDRSRVRSGTSGVVGLGLLGASGCSSDSVVKQTSVSNKPSVVSNTETARSVTARVGPAPPAGRSRPRHRYPHRSHRTSDSPNLESVAIDPMGDPLVYGEMLEC